MSDTPRTDVFAESGPLQRPTLGDALDFARELERELAEARMKAEGITPEDIAETMHPKP